MVILRHVWAAVHDVVTITWDRARRVDSTSTAERALWTSGWVISGVAALLGPPVWATVTIVSALMFLLGLTRARRRDVR